MCLIFLLIFLFVPWQVAFLGCWLIHLYTCASSAQLVAYPGSTPTPRIEAIPLVVRGNSAESDEGVDTSPQSPQAGVPEPRATEYQLLKASNHNHNMHLLLLMTWLLPLAAPVLAVWVRTLATAGLTTPFDGDHFFLNVAPFLILVDFASWTPGPVFERRRCGGFVCLADLSELATVQTRRSTFCTVVFCPSSWGGFFSRSKICLRRV